MSAASPDHNHPDHDNPDHDNPNHENPSGNNPSGNNPSRNESEVITADLTLLGRDARGPVEHVETFPAPTGCERVVFSTDEVGSICPVTEQPDISSVRIDYVPNERCIESKSLKMYLWSFRNRKVFAETLAVEIADEVWNTVQPVSVHVAVTQHARGGIVTETYSSHPRPA